MPQIQQLPPHLADLIAAGEVVERPASVCKELLENALDAGASAISTELEKGGLTYIRITDNGCGIAPEQLPTAFLRHATSKLRRPEDLAAIGTLGFSIYFRVSERNVAAATFGGALGWGVYLLCFHLWGNVFAANVVATAVVYFWSVAMARVLKAPSNTYLIPGIIPLLPGGPLYYTMAGLVGGDRALFTKNGTTTILVTFGMVTGMVAAAVVFYYILKLQQKCSRKSPAPPQD